MLSHLKYFLWLVYAAAVLQLVASGLPDKSWRDFTSFVIVAIIIIGLALLAVRKEAKYAIWLLAICFAVDIANTVGELWGDGTFWLRQALAPDHPVTHIQMILDAATNFLECAALYFYFSGGRLAKDVDTGSRSR